VYLADNWPEMYRGAIYMHNIHGRRLNQDRLERRGSGYVGRHGEDLFPSDDPWMRGVALLYGPDGGVFMSDWSDLGECHDNDGVHRTSGRIYKMTYGAPKDRKPDLAKLDGPQLVKLLDDPNEWFVRRAMRLLQERGPDPAVNGALAARLASHPKPTGRLRALWALHRTGGLSPEVLLKCQDHDDENLRAWALRLLGDGVEPPEAAVVKAAGDASARVRLEAASALQRLPPAKRWAAIERLAARAEDAADANLPLMIWYGAADAAAADRARATALLPKIKIPLVARFTARLLAEK
jgi:hypothetical protein